MRLGRVGGTLLVALGTACGGSGSGPDPTPSTPPTTATAQSYNMRLLAHVSLEALTAHEAHAHHDEPIEGLGALSGSGNWGYTTADGRRFALTGTSVGLSIVEVTRPEQPESVALVEGPSSQWREVRTWGPFAYVTTEAVHGLDVVDLRAPDQPRKLRTWNQTFVSAHTLCVDDSRGLLFVNGTRDTARQATGMRVLDARRDPANPREVGSFEQFYIHDCYVRGGYLFASAIYDGFEAVLDISDPARIRELTRFHTGGRFTHNSWLTGDGRYLFTTDERPGRPLEGWDLSDMRNPRKVSEYIAQAGTIPHNVMIDGNRMVVSHYTEGVHLLDVSDPTRPRVMGFYDTYDGSFGGFAGDWGAYIFPASDLIVASDLQGGLFVVQYTGP
ncbi:MAG TPA: choice-of-anchor B family protein [Vicinamibacteria bacterium]|nr:choice-of-anchor B family protein [Vicinamibacteria bacterium]